LPNLKIRPVCFEDLPQIEEIESSSFPDPYPLLLFETLAAHNPETFLIAVEGKRIVGYISAMNEKQKTIHIASIAVHPTRRRRSIARRLVTALLKTLRSMNVASVKLEVRSSNTAARSLYETLGFRHSKTLKGYYEDGEDAAVMELTLQ